MRVCFLLGGLQGNGGIGRVTSIIANSLCQFQYDVSVISFVETANPRLYTLDKRIESYVLYRETTSMTLAILSKHAIRKLKKILKDNDIDILVACGALYFPLAVASCKKSNTRCFCWEHINPKTTSDYKFQGLCRKIGIRFAEKLLVLTKTAEKYYLEQLHAEPEKVVQIYNPAEKSSCVEYNEKSKKIISVGRLCPQKNYEMLLEIAKDILDEHLDWEWDIYGEGELRPILVDKAKMLGISDRINFKGQVMDLYDRYKKYSFMVMTSRYEGFPMALLEGLANGLPLVCFDVETGPNEIIADGENGYLIEPFDKKKMIDKIRYLIEEPEVRKQLSKHALDTSKQFGLERIIKQWEKVLE